MDNKKAMKSLKTQLLQFLGNPDYPCIGAKAAVKKNSIDIIIADDLTAYSDPS